MENLKTAFLSACLLVASLVLFVAVMLVPVAVFFPEKLRTLHFLDTAEALFLCFAITLALGFALLQMRSSRYAGSGFTGEE